MDSIAMIICWSNEEDEDEEYNKREIINIRRSIRSKFNPFDLPDAKFNKYFGLNKAAFSYLLDEITNNIMGIMHPSSVPVVVRLAAILRFCVEGSYQTGLGNDFALGLAQPTVSKIITEMTDILEDFICPTWIKFDNDSDEKEETKRYFYKKYGIPGVIGCVDGTHIKIQAPKKSEQPKYYNKKGFYSLNAMIICDHKMYIRYIDAKHSGANHDSHVWKLSSLRGILQRNFNRGEKNTWLLGDAGYPLEPFLMTPYRSTAANTAESRFNMVHSKARKIIERTIGVLKNKFRCLLGVRPLHYAPQKATQIVNVCAALHNICVHYKCDTDGFTDPNSENKTDTTEGEASVDTCENFNDNELAVKLRDKLRNSVNKINK